MVRCGCVDFDDQRLVEYLSEAKGDSTRHDRCKDEKDGLISSERAG